MLATAGGRAGSAGGGIHSPLRRSTNRSSVGTPKTSRPGTRAASAAFSIGTIRRPYPARRAPDATATAPWMGRSVPLSDSSPHTA